MTNSPSSPIQLDRPGAGLPKVEKFIGGLLLRRAIRRYDRARVDAELAAETESVLELARRCKDPSRPILIDRIRGIEDSSRNWSVFMTIDHLRIVSDGIGQTIRALANGRSPERKARIEDVKPSPDAGADSLEALADSVATFRREVSAIPFPYSAATADHPWFGPLEIAGWHTMSSLHMKIHRQQVEHIMAGLDRS